MKQLYIVAGGSDGYVSIFYTFNEDAAEWFVDQTEDGSNWSDVESLLVPDDFELPDSTIDESYQDYIGE